MIRVRAVQEKNTNSAAEETKKIKNPKNSLQQKRLEKNQKFYFKPFFIFVYLIIKLF